MLRIPKIVLALVAIGAIISLSLLLTMTLNDDSNRSSIVQVVPTFTPSPIETSTPVPTVEPTATPTPVVAAGKSYGPIGTEAELLALVNQARAQRGLLPYQVSEKLSHAARAHSNDMASTDQRSHVGSNGTTYHDRIQQTGYAPIVSANETIGWGFTTPQMVVEWWLNSDIHRPILLSPHYTEMGIGFSLGNDQSNRYYWVATYGSRTAGTNDIAVQPSIAQN